MTISYPRVLEAIRADSANQMLSCFEGLSAGEVAELATFIGDKRLNAIITHSAGTFDLSRLDVRRPPTLATPANQTFSVRDLLAETQHQAFGTGMSSSTRAVAPSPAQHAISVGLADVRRRRDAALLLAIPEDPTGTLPQTPATVPPPIGNAEFAASAQRNNVHVAAIKAVSKVESGGRSGFDRLGRPKILFEAHHFGPRTGNIFDKTHPHLSCPNTKVARLRARKYYSWDQYERLKEAIILREDAALESASWGKFQVMGFNHSGWPDVRSFVAAMYESEENHLKSFEAFCGPGLMGALRRKDWTTFARGYNGKAQVGYDTLIGQAYQAFGGP